MVSEPELDYNGRMIGWNILAVEAAGVPCAGYLGMVTLPGRALFFAVGGGQEVVLSARRKEAGTRAFRTGKQLQIDYRRFPSHSPERGIAPLLEELAGRILAREVDLAARIDAVRADVATVPARGVSDGLPGTGTADGSANTTVPARGVSDGLPGTGPAVERWHEGDVLCLRTAAGDGREPLLVRVGPRGRFPLDLFHWSAGVMLDDGSPADSLVPAAQALLLETVGRLLFDVAPPGIARNEASPTGPATYFYFNLGRRGIDAGAPDSPATGSSCKAAGGSPFRPTIPPGPLVLCLDVPSTCENRCLFCAAGSDDTHRIRQAQEGAAGELRRILDLLRPAIAASPRVDVSFTGRDALAMPGIVELAARIRKEPNIGRLTAVTPGCHLTDVRLVQRLREGGIDSVVLTLLGPDAATHDRVAGRKGAYRDLLASIRNLKAEGMGWELNTVVVRQNIRLLARTLARVESLGARVRLYHFLSEPEIPSDMVRRCMPRYGSLARILDCHRPLVERAVSSIQYVPLCVLPDWARPLAGDSSRQSPEPPDSLPTACAACPEFGRGCASVGRRYLKIYGDGELDPVAG